MSKKEIIKKRTEMPTQDPKERGKNFNEVALGYTEEMALSEAKRCLNCVKRNCVVGCPVEVPIPEFIKLIQQMNYAEAINKIWEKNCLPAICGRVCPQETQCEEVCTLGKIKDSTPVAVGRLERFVADWARKNLGKDKPHPQRTPTSNNIKVAIVGSGPAGLTCAGDLAQIGYDVTIFEAFHVTGGVLMYGIPQFRLPKEIVQEEILDLRDLGVKIECNQVIGKVLTIEDLHEMGYQAIFIGVGAGTPKFMNIPGIELNGVLSANEFLTRVNLMKAYKFPESDTMVDIGKTVAVIGGGNVAMDSARTALRLGAQKVMIIYRRSAEEIPARKEEFEHAQEEGIDFQFLRSPTKIIGNEKGFVKALEIQKMGLGEPDSSGRRRPVPEKGSEYILDVDMVIMAIGTDANPLLTKETGGLKLNKEGYIETNEKTQTSIPYVFAGGDIVTGSATVISAMGAGRKAATAIHEYLQGKK